MSETVQLALIATIAPTLASLVAVYVSIQGNKAAKKASEKIDIIGDKTTEIHTSTNGTLASMTKALEVSHTEIAGLKDMVASLVKSKAVADGIALATASSVEPIKKEA